MIYALFIELLGLPLFSRSKWNYNVYLAQNFKNFLIVRIDLYTKSPNPLDRHQYSIHDFTTYKDLFLVNSFPSLVTIIFDSTIIMLQFEVR